ncbi:MAG TPA: ATPase [Myxococcota bacterium]|nr:ATPase [Myxococcota bacterium]
MSNDEFDDVSSTLVGMDPVDYDEVEQKPEARSSVNMKPVTRPRKPEDPVFMPEPPHSVRDTGLSHSYLEELVLKHLFQGGDMSGVQIAERVCLPFAIVEDTIERLRKMKLIDIKGSSHAGIGRSGMIIAMTDAGHRVCEHSMDRDRYVGPAPVPFSYYCQAVAAQTIRGNALQRSDVEPNFTDLVLRDEIYDAIGPAMNSGKALFFYGPPGNGKTAICQRMTNCFGGDVFVPHAVIVDDFVIKVFDETIHKPVEHSGPLDKRWVLCSRPMVVVGGELTLDDLNLSYSEQVKYYEAPVQMKANCGMLLVDDFGRQTVSPKALLNRWIVPLESEMDFFSMHTGKKLQVPFDVFVVFSTNLDPAELVDEAFLRRVRYKLEVGRPDEPLYKEIFQAECEKHDVIWDEGMMDYLIREHYSKYRRPFNCCEPRDLLAQVQDLCAYRGITPQMTENILDQVAANYFVNFKKATPE